MTGAELLLVHVADGWAARHFDDLKLRESEEMKADRVYLEQLAASMPRPEGDDRAGDGRSGERADPAGRGAQVDLIAMSTHGHRFLNDLIRGTTVSKVRHMVRIPVLLLRAQ